MKIIFIFAQAFGVIAWLLMVISYYQKSKNKILFVQLLAIIFYCLNYIFLGAYVGMIVIVFELIRDFAFYKSDKDKLVFLFTIPVYILLALLNLDKPIELIPIAASLLEGFTFTKNKKFIVSGALLVYVMWIIYDLKVFSYTGAITDAIIVFSNLMILVKYFIINSHIADFKVYNHYTITKITLKSISNLDKKVYPKNLCWAKEYQEKMYEVNPKSFSIIKYKASLVGYVNYLVISKDKYMKLVNTEVFDIEYDTDDILSLCKDKKNYLVIDSIVLDEQYDSKKLIKIYNKMIKTYISDKINEGYNIENIISVGVTNFEKEVLNSSILNNKKMLKDNNILYSYRKI